MASHLMLDGWDVHVTHRTTLDDNGETVKVWTLVLQERDTGSTIRYEHGDHVRDFIIQGYNPGIVLPG